MNTYGEDDRPELVVVDAGAMQELTEKYAEYRHLVERKIFDPVQAMRLGGKVLSSVREVIRTGQPVQTNGPA